MTEGLIQKLEEKMMVLLAEVVDLRKEIQLLTQENALLRREKESNTSKLQDLISLFDAIPMVDDVVVETYKPNVMQETLQEEGFN